MTSDTKLVTITIGGNDIGFTNLIIACTTLGCASQIATSQNQINNAAAGQARRDLQRDPRQARHGARSSCSATAARSPTAAHLPGGDGRVVLGGDVAQRARRQPQQHDQGAGPGARLQLRRRQPVLVRPRRLREQPVHQRAEALRTRPTATTRRATATPTATCRRSARSSARRRPPRGRRPWAAHAAGRPQAIARARSASSSSSRPSALPMRSPSSSRSWATR